MSRISHPYASSNAEPPEQERPRRRRRASRGKPAAGVGRTLPGLPAITAPLERRWECLIQFDQMLAPGERSFVNDLIARKHWHGEKLTLTKRQQAWLASIYAGLRARLAGGRNHG